MGPVDIFAGPEARPLNAVMRSIAQIAARDGVTKQAVSKNVRHLLDRGLYIERSARGDVGGVDVVSYDRLRGRKPVETARASTFASFVPMTAVAAAVRDVEDAAITVIDRLPSRAKELAAAAAANGDHGVRELLEKIASDLRADLGHAWRALAGKGLALAAAGSIATDIAPVKSES